MANKNDKVSQLLADSRLAFINQQNELALDLAKKAIMQDSTNPETYKSAGNANMSLGQYDEAIRYYGLAAKHDPNNGNRYYDLGFAYATAEKLAEAMKSFAKAEELGCAPENLVQLYSALGIVCFNIGRFDDALINLEKAEQIIGVDLDILQRKAIIYGIKDDVRSGLLTANQIKLIAPSEYIGYQIAFKLLIQAKRLEAARKELEKARKYTAASMVFYSDCMTLELEEYQTDQDEEHFKSALTYIVEALNTAKPTVVDVIESYINAAEIHLQLNDSAQTINCLNAAQNPVGAYNNGFEVIVQKFDPIELSEYDVEDMIEGDRLRIAENYGEYGLEELVASAEPDEEGNREYFTEIENELQDTGSAYKLDESLTFEHTKDNIDQINRLFIGAYTLEKDFNRVIEYARKLQTSENISNEYIGRYSEVNAMKELGLPETERRYEELIKFFRNAMIKDPTDIIAVTFRIQCYIDISKYDEAEQLCTLLTKEMREPLLDKIKEMKSGG